MAKKEPYEQADITGPPQMLSGKKIVKKLAQIKAVLLNREYGGL
jgi:hypothetical protein